MEASMDRKNSVGSSSKASTAQEVTIQSLGKTIKNEHVFLQKTTQ
jgi:hypothetical protein